MATRLHLDTHAVVWLHQGALDKFTKRGLEALEAHALVYCPVVALELQFLREIGRLRIAPEQILGDLRKDIGLEANPLEYLRVVWAACREGWTRDPFDRQIVAQARLDNSPLLSRDRVIRENYAATLW